MTLEQAKILENLQNRGYMIVHAPEDDFPEIVRFIDNPDKKGWLLMATQTDYYHDIENIPYSNMKVYREEGII